MNTNRLPEHIDPYRFAEQGVTIQGVISLSTLNRLPIDHAKEKTDVSVTLSFQMDEDGVPVVKGHLNAHFHLECQRCLHPLPYEIMSDFVLGVAKSLEEAKSLPKHYEPILTHAGELALWVLVEDELLLNLPLIPRHDLETCAVKTPVRETGEVTEKVNPFVVLQSLKESN